MNPNDLPAIYATKPYPGVSSSYVFIPTRPILERLSEQGWEIKAASQTRSYNKDREPYARHMIRLRHIDLKALPDPRGGADLFAELVIINGHDGSATYRLLAGLFSYICSNGLIVGSMLAGATIRHSGLKATIEAVEGGAAGIVAQEIPLLAQSVERMAARQLTRSEQHDFARHAMELRYRGLSPLLTTDQVLTRHRDADRREDTWTTLNVIQENVLSKTHQGRSFTGRRSNIRAVRAIKEQVHINRGLWDYASKLAA